MALTADARKTKLQARLDALFFDQAETEKGTPPMVLFDPAAAWRALDSEAQAEIGIAAIVHILGAIGSAEVLKPYQAFEAADMEGINALEAGARDHLAEAFDGQLPRRPDLAAIGVQSCRQCGCTDAHACPEGCSWVESDLCSACASVANDDD